MTIGDMAEQEKDMEIEKDQEAPGTEDRAEECAEAPEPEKGQQAGETGQEETADEAGEESEAAPEGVDPKTWAEKRAARKQLSFKECVIAH